MNTLSRFTSVRLSRVSATIAFVAVAAAYAQALAASFPLRLENDHLVAEFDQNGLACISHTSMTSSVIFNNDSCALTVNSQVFHTATLPAPSISQSVHRIEYLYRAGRHGLKVVYQLQPGWRFVSKQLMFASRDTGFLIGTVVVCSATMRSPVQEELPLKGGKYGVCLRLADSAGTSASVARASMFVLVQNPFMLWTWRTNRFSAAYVADMPWKSSYGPFMSDRCCIGIQPLSGVQYPVTMVPEWLYLPNPTNVPADQRMMDIAETDALIECVRSFLLYHPTNSTRIHVGWCENDYQIDVGTPAGREEYKRIIDRAAQLGCRNILYGPSNERFAPMSQNADAWGWERVLWLSLGQKIRKGEWIPGRDKLPEHIAKMLSYAKSKRVRLVAYAYPTLGFLQNPEWTAWTGGRIGGYSGVDTGVRSFQDWWVASLTSFYYQAGIGGYSFDHWWMAYDGASSRYAQWFGCRRILESLRTAAPGILIDGRQQYHHFGPWTWLAGTYPHPMASDEQPGSFKAFPDLHTDRVAGNRQRYIAWWYRMTQFTPTEILPGFITHQTQRSDDKGTMHNDRFRPRDWDVLGWKYSLLSSIASAPMNHVVNMIPARDTDEFKAFSPADARWFNYWLDWTDKNFDCLRSVRQIIGQPMVGRVDGTAAFSGDHGFVFLFNPNYRPLTASFSLDQSIGLTCGASFVIAELHPVPGRPIGKPAAAWWRHGDSVSIPLDGAQAMVLEISPAVPPADAPMLFNVPGTASLSNGLLRLSGVRGEIGTACALLTALPASAPVSAVSVNGIPVPFARTADVVSCSVSFPGVRFSQCQQAGAYDPASSGGCYRASFTVPARILTQLEARRIRWPVPYSDDDLRATWLGSHRLLMFINIADPREDMEVSLKVAGKPVQLHKAYNSIYPQGRQTFLGFYADLSDIQPDRPHDVEVSLPLLAPGQFQGLFFDNIETEFTAKVSPITPAPHSKTTR